MKAIDRMNSDPKYFFRYQKRFSKKKDEIGDLVTKINGKDVTATDDKMKANILSKQYKSIWSNPKEEYVVNDLNKFFGGCSLCRQESVHICQEDIFIKEAITYHDIIDSYTQVNEKAMSEAFLHMRIY